ncbi:hypothetical protein HYQ46_010604 [Verticillium longisporum]|nr:hypothetical protein HYQ46_010604 [Verticillium longisporum]
MTRASSRSRDPSRAPITPAAQAKPASPPARSPVASQPPPTKTFSAPAPSPAAAPVASASPADAATSSSGNTQLAEIKQLLEQQTKIITHLASEVDSLKRKINAPSGGSQDQSERIRQLELELEAYREE